MSLCPQFILFQQLSEAAIQTIATRALRRRLAPRWDPGRHPRHRLQRHDLGQTKTRPIQSRGQLRRQACGISSDGCFLGIKGSKNQACRQSSLPYLFAAAVLT